MYALGLVTKNMIQINNEKCKYNSAICCEGEKNCECKEICPVDAFIDGENLKIDQSKCIECGACVVVCKQKAIEIK